LEYKGVRLECGYRIDLLVAGLVIVEIKSVEALAPIHEAQVLTYLKLTRIKIELLINFNVVVLSRASDDLCIEFFSVFSVSPW